MEVRAILRELTIKNFAIIDFVHIDFKSGFTVMTGETGAGKSILIGALSLLLGGKASPKVIRSGVAKAQIEAYFYIPPSHHKWEELGEKGIEAEEGNILIVRREITLKGRSRCYLNDTAVTVSAMSQAVSGLIVIQGQHQQKLLLEPVNHLTMLDRYAGLWEKRREIGLIYNQVADILHKIVSLRKKERARVQQHDMYSFQIREIDQAELIEGEDKNLRREEKIISSSHKFVELLQRSYFSLYENDASINTSLSSVLHDLEELSEIDESLKATVEQCESIMYQLQDIAEDLRYRRDMIDVDPKRLEWVINRLEEINRLKKKYGDTIAEILEYRKKIEKEILEEEFFEQKQKELSKKLNLEGEKLRKAAIWLSQQRRKSAKKMEREMIEELEELGMHSVQFEIHFSEIANSDFEVDLPLPFPVEGLETVEFFISPNIGEEVRPVSQIASGGELSRIMLAFRTMVANLDDIDTIIFDEVDVGIGGQIARVIGQKLKKIANTRQVICITHLAQIASQSPSHLLVTKEERNGRTYSKILRLSEKERVQEIARMLDGETKSPLSKHHASELLAINKKEQN